MKTSKEEIWESIKKGFRNFIRGAGYYLQSGYGLTYEKAVQLNEWIKSLQKDKK
ncbi:MAG: hypothetical protein ACFFAO_19635 [Candidatus Hermodarchaeota archaeon]